MRQTIIFTSELNECNKTAESKTRFKNTRGLGEYK